MLKRHGYSVLSSGSTAEAMTVAQQHAGSIDLLITDLVLPGMSGRKMADHLTSQRPEMRVLYVSGYGDSSGPLTECGVPAEAVLHRRAGSESARSLAGSSVGPDAVTFQASSRSGFISSREIASGFRTAVPANILRGAFGSALRQHCVRAGNVQDFKARARATASCVAPASMPASSSRSRAEVVRAASKIGRGRSCSAPRTWTAVPSQPGEPFWFGVNLVRDAPVLYPDHSQVRSKSWPAKASDLAVPAPVSNVSSQSECPPISALHRRLRRRRLQVDFLHAHRAQERPRACSDAGILCAVRAGAGSCQHTADALWRRAAGHRLPRSWRTGSR